LFVAENESGSSAARPLDPTEERRWKCVGKKHVRSTVDNFKLAEGMPVAAQAAPQRLLPVRRSVCAVPPALIGRYERDGNFANSRPSG
jgi:hypothetical protein